MSIKYWWSSDRKWFCVLVDNGVSQATVSITPEEADALADEAMRTPEYLATEAKGQETVKRLLKELRECTFPHCSCEIKCDSEPSRRTSE